MHGLYAGLMDGRDDMNVEMLSTIERGLIRVRTISKKEGMIDLTSWGKKVCIAVALCKDVLTEEKNDA